MPARVFAQISKGTLLVPGLAVRPIGPEGIPDVDDGKHARRKWNGFAGQSPWVPLSVPPLVVAVRDVERRLEESDARDHLVRPYGVLAHELPLVLVQGSGLLEYRVRDADLADVMQKGPSAHMHQVFLGNAHPARQFDGELRHALGVPLRFPVPQVEGAHPPLERAVVRVSECLVSRFQLAHHPFVSRDVRRDTEHPCDFARRIEQGPQPALEDVVAHCHF